MRNGMRVVDTDTHQMEPISIWTDYIEPKFRDRAPTSVTTHGHPSMIVEGEKVVSEGNYPMSPPEFIAAVNNAMKRFKRAADGKYAPKTRIMDMDDHGVDVQIIYPTRGGQILGKPFKDTELLSACCQAYNKWSMEFCSEDPTRLRWAAMLPLQDPQLAIQEAKRAAEDGCVSFYLRPNPVENRNLYHSDYDPLWETIQKLDLPICLHDSGSPVLPSYGDRMETHVTGHIIAHPFEAMVAMMSIIWYGVLERFPELTVVHVEADAGWLPYWLQRMEQHWDFSGNAEHPELKLRPTDYFKRQVYVAARGDEMTLPAAVELVGEDNILFNTDYPHPDGTFPWGFGKFEEQKLSDVVKRKILWDNAANAFNLK